MRIASARMVWKPFECAARPRIAWNATGFPVTVSCSTPQLSVHGIGSSIFLRSPTTTGGSAITEYRVTSQRLNANGTNNGAATVSTLASTVRSTTFTAPAGVPANTTYRFTVQAVNAVGVGTARTVTGTVR